MGITYDAFNLCADFNTCSYGYLNFDVIDLQLHFNGRFIFIVETILSSIVSGSFRLNWFQWIKSYHFQISIRLAKSIWIFNMFAHPNIDFYCFLACAHFAIHFKLWTVLFSNCFCIRHQGALEWVQCWSWTIHCKRKNQEIMLTHRYFSVSHECIGVE